MTTRKYHKLLGTLLVLPMIAWALTGAVFMIKPGYGDAYSPLVVKSYPIQAPLTIVPADNWLEMKLLRTVLGRHLLVTTPEASLHFHADTATEYLPPDEASLTKLIDDATAQNRNRYGHVERIEGDIVYMSTGVDITVNWPTLTLQQKGNDTRLIGQLYKIHYLQWTPSASLNKILAILGLGLLLCLTILGIRLIVTR